MIYPIRAEGFEGQDILAKTSFWSGPRLSVNGRPAPKGSQRGEMTLQRNDGRQVVASWKSQALGFDVPQLVVDGRVIELVKPLAWYQWAWGGLPLLLVFSGGALGAIAGIAGFTINAQVFRVEMKGFVKYLVTGLVSVLSVAAYLFAAVLLKALVGR